ncbi:hypothetical protein E2542_SST19878 [Spatholobus suberectus]|nr:hypothetical protein E2542_SST19878 [Spatholobus suberectus]
MCIRIPRLIYGKCACKIDSLVPLEKRRSFFVYLDGGANDKTASGNIFCLVEMPIRSLVEVEPPSPLRYLIGAAVMMIGVVLPVGYMMFRNKRVPSSSSYSKQTNKVLI